MPEKILVSSCLIGKKCAYDGKARISGGLCELSHMVTCVDVCPEIEGGLSCPRDRNEIVNGSGGDVLNGKARVVSSKGVDRTENFIAGAQAALDKALTFGVKFAVLKAHSPSCAKMRIHTGKFDGVLCDGSGVTAALLRRNGVAIFTEVELGDLCSCLGVTLSSS